MFMFRKKLEMPTAAEALPGRPDAIPTAATHYVLKRPLKGPYPAGLESAIFGLGCFWGAERAFWKLGEGIYTTAVGYAAGFTASGLVTVLLLGFSTAVTLGERANRQAAATTSAASLKDRFVGTWKLNIE